MANVGVNQGRRRFLTATTAVVGGAGAATALVPFIKSWLPSERAKNAGAPVLQDISKVQPGQRIIVGWRGQPVWIVNRTKAMLDTLPQVKNRLRDPDSKVADQQPKFAQNETRSLKDKPEWFVVIGICTHLGCSPDFVPEIKAEPFDPEWKGGFFCPCHKSRYDIAGRVFQGVPAPMNLVVPPYKFVDDKHILIGVNPEGAA
ncbi:MAG: ubiquinol-cytochrome c reductase iron-sulfur subunit [Gammaproteobacteria bacterium]|nr:MAG: ubiquinol-cytochrome c reductase iron-sulfur subunit [Gammaproteobacteria bacterium]